MDIVIDFLTKKYSDKEFLIPYSDWSIILSRIEKKYIIRNDKTQPFSNWINHLKGKQYIRTVSYSEITQVLERLEAEKQYWLVVDIYNNPDEKHKVLGCTITVLESMITLYTTGLKTTETTISYVGNCFFLLDSKLNWLTIFEVDRKKRELMIFKSGDAKTPFDN